MKTTAEQRKAWSAWCGATESIKDLTDDFAELQADNENHLKIIEALRAECVTRAEESDRFRDIFRAMEHDVDRAVDHRGQKGGMQCNDGGGELGSAAPSSLRYIKRWCDNALLKRTP